MADPDIVVRLRQGWLAHWDTDVRFVMVYASEWVRLTNLTTESADEIERLRSVVEAWLKYSQRAEREIERLRAERDEVRQSYCSLMEAYRGGDGRVTANKLGWGYLFEEDKPCQ